MVVKKRKKTTKLQGSRTHGWGLVHRNSGQRGGAGNASRGKKAHAKKPSNWQDKNNPRYFGKQGFVHKGPVVEDVIITFREIENNLPLWLEEKKVFVKGDAYEINLTNLGYTKLLSNGKPTKKLLLTINKATEKAVNKITQASGIVTITAKQK